MSPRKNLNFLQRLAIVPALLGVLAASASVGIKFVEEGSISKIKDLFENPVGIATLVVYSTVILAILTLVVYQLALSARTTDRSETPPELTPEPIADGPKPPPLTPEEVAAREHERHISGIRFSFSRNRRRMIEETERIQRNGFLNLTIGILFSVIALGILGYPLIVSNNTPVTEWIGLFERFAPRFSVGILIQIIGFFFLRLYVSGENEIRYIRNEITNLESRLAACHAAAVMKDATALRDIIKQLVRTERNFRLRKGERTLYGTDETYNDVRQLLKDSAEAIRGKSRKSDIS